MDTLKSQFPYLFALLIALFIYHWNVDRSVEHSLLTKCSGGYYEHYLLEEMQELIEIAKKDGWIYTQCPSGILIIDSDEHVPDSTEIWNNKNGTKCTCKKE